MELLPVELWSYICTFLYPPDLASLALTSTEFLSPARWHLYNKVILRSDAPELHHTLRLLTNNRTLCRRVITLVIDTSDKWTPQGHDSASSAPWFTADIFQQMVRLRRIEFKRVPCGPLTDGIQQTRTFQDILASIYQQCRTLREVSLDEIWGPRLPHEWTIESVRPYQFPVASDLRKLIYKAKPDAAVHWSFLISTFFHRSPSSLDHLDLDVGRHTSHFQVLAGLSFPRLRTLYLRGLPRVSSTPLTVFLVAHPSLRYVHLLDSDPYLSKEKMNINMLPNLHTISAKPSVLARLAEKCDSLRYIRCLFLDYDGIDDAVRSTEIMIDVTKGFPNLRHISCSRIIRGELTAEVMALFYASVELECWSGGFYFRDVSQIDSVTQVLSIFPALARLDVCEWTYPDVPSPTTAQMRALLQLAQAARVLKKITLYQTHIPSKEISAVFLVDSGGTERRITRRDNRAIVLRKTYQYVEGGPHIQDRRRVEFASVDWQEEALLLT